jgi:hypothetical protein
VSAARSARPTARGGWAALILAALPAFLTLALALSQHGLIGDIGFDIANGRWIMQHGYIPLANHLTSAMSGAYWSNEEWLFGLYTAWLYTWGGSVAVFVGLLPLLAGIAVLLAWAARGLAPYWRTLWPLATAVAILPVMSPRPQLLSFLLFAYAVAAIGAARRGRTLHLWLTSLSALLWVQVHGSVLLLPLVLGLNWLLPSQELPRRRIVAPFLTSLLLLFVRPGGPLAVLRNLVNVGSGGNTNVIAEWASPNFHEPWAMAAALVLLAAIGLLMPELWRRRRWADLILLVGSAAALLYAARFLPYFILTVALLALPYVPQSWRIAAPQEIARAGGRSLLLSALIALFLGVMFFSRPVFPQRAPMKAIAYLVRHHASDVFAAYQIGSSLELYGVEPYLDSRDNLWLQRSWWPRFLDVTGGAMPVTAYLKRFDPSARYVLWQMRSPVAVELDASRKWQRVLVDPNVLGPARASYGAYGVWRKVGTS